MEKKINKFIYWTPRILAIIFVLFLMMFSLDVFDTNLGFWETVLGLFMHNIPALILLAVVIISWKKEIVGAYGFTIAGLLYVLLLTVNALRGQFEWYMISWSLTIAGPAFVIAYLFYLNWKKKKA